MIYSTLGESMMRRIKIALGVFVLFFPGILLAQEIKTFQPLSRLLSRGEVVIEVDDAILVAHEIGPINRADIAVLKLDQEGQTIEKFGKAGIFRLVSPYSDRVFGMGVQGSGRIVLAGYRKIKTKTSLFLAASTKHGLLDTQFGEKGTVRIDFEGNAEAHYLQILPDGRIAISGYIERKGNYNFLFALFTKNGQLDFSFGQKGWVEIDHGPNDRFYGLALDHKNLVAAGYEKTTAGTRCVMASVDETGVLREDFGDSGFIAVEKMGYDTACSAIIRAGKGYWVTGYKKSDRTQMLLARVDDDGAVTLLSEADDEMKLRMAHALVQDGPKIWVTGEGIRQEAHKQETGFFVSDHFIPLLPSGLDLESASMTVDRRHRLWLTGHVRGRMVVMRVQKPSLLP